MEFFRKVIQAKNFRIIAPVFLGAFAGFLYYNFIGCNGSCAITGNPWISTAYGAVMGSLFIKKQKKELSNG